MILELKMTWYVITSAGNVYNLTWKSKEKL